jgi:hypothetical protein
MHAKPRDPQGKGSGVDAHEQRRLADENAAAQRRARQEAAQRAEVGRLEKVRAQAERERRHAEAEVHEKIDSALKSSTSYDTSVTVAAPVYLSMTYRKYVEAEAERLRSLGFQVSVEESRGTVYSTRISMTSSGPSGDVINFTLRISSRYA